ncbi:5-oxoprolinase subunit PxpB [Thermoflavimicrobium daqui]|jgi:inhibitor of KinA|nr:5-oxoprolinase subunit PxpB [Thermoflavimicrobium daqui]
MPLNEYAVTIELGDQIDEIIHQRVKRLNDALEERAFLGLVEIVMTYTTLTVFYDPTLIAKAGNEFPYSFVCSYIKDLIESLDDRSPTLPNLVEIPVCYGGEYGPDLDEVAKFHGLSLEEVIQIHSEPSYLVYMIGFAPGFPYLGGMSAEIATPRKHTPSLSIPIGSVGIAGSQTGIYPISTPGGWHIIGRTPLTLFDSKKSPPSLLQAGDRVRFRPISKEQYIQWKEGKR